MKRVLSLLVVLVYAFFAYADDKLIVVSVPSYNNIQYYRKNLDSILRQQYSNFYVVYVDDCSTDGTAQAVEAYIKEHQCEDRVLLVKNTERRGALYNHYMVAHALPNDAIVVTVDGDDWLPDTKNTVLSRINAAYQDPEVWMTYGQFEEYPTGKLGFCRALPEVLKSFLIYRDFAWLTSHPRTYYAGLFKQVPLGYFIRDNNFLQATCDLAIMFALLELSCGRAQFIDEVLYTYNTTNSNSDCYTRNLEQIHNDHWVRTRTPLQPLAACPAVYTKSVYYGEFHNVHLSFDATSCAAYCATLSTAGIMPYTVQIMYAPCSEDEIKRYEALKKEYRVWIVPLDAASDFKTQLCARLDLFAEDSYIVLTTDDCRWQQSFDVKDVMYILAKTKAVCYCCVRGCIGYSDSILAVSQLQPKMIHLHDDYYVWKPNGAQGTWHHPYASPAIMVSTATLRSLLDRVQCATPAEFLCNSAYLAVDNNDDVVLCSAVPACGGGDMQ